MRGFFFVPLKLVIRHIIRIKWSNDYVARILSDIKLITYLCLGEYSMSTSKVTLTDLDTQGVEKISAGLNRVLANVFALYIKTKNFHWHVSGPHFQSYHLLLDEQATEILSIVDLAAERSRKLGKMSIRSLGEIAQLQTIEDNNDENISATDMLTILMNDNKSLAQELRALHEITDEYNDYATTNLLDDWINQAEQRAWFLYESSRA